MGDVIKTARAELERERFRAAVEAEKAKLRERELRPWWRKIFPFVISIKRRV